MNIVVSLDEKYKTVPRSKPTQVSETEFPIGALPSPVREMVVAIADTASVPTSLAAVCCLGAVSGSIGAGLSVKSQRNRMTGGNLYLLGIAASGSGKSETFRHAMGPLLTRDSEHIDDFNRNERPRLMVERGELDERRRQGHRKLGKVSDPEDQANLREELQQIERRLSEVEIECVPPQLIVEDATIEDLPRRLARNGETILSASSDAGAIVANLAGRYKDAGHSEETLYLKSYSREKFRQDRVGRAPVHLASPCMAICWLGQPDKLDRLLTNRSLVDGGLIPRFLFCDTGALPQYEAEIEGPGIPEHTAAHYDRLLGSLLDAYRMTAVAAVVSPTCAAAKTLRDYHNETIDRRKSELKDVDSFAARWAENAWRVAVCLHASRYGSDAHRFEIDHATAEDAVAIVKWFSNEQLDILNRSRSRNQEERLKKLRQIISASENQAATLRDLAKNNGFKTDEVERLTADFPDKLKIETRQAQSGGRPSKVVTLPK